MTDFTMFAGDTKTLEVEVKDPGGAVVDLTNSEVRWKLARTVKAEPVLSKALTDGITMIDAQVGRFDVEIATGDTEALRGDFYHEAEVILEDGTVATVVTGAVTIEPTLIKPETP